MSKLESRASRIVVRPLVLSAVLVGTVPMLAVAAEESFDRAARTEEVRQTEIAFARTVMDDQPEKFASFLDEQAVFVGGAGPTRGKAEIAQEWKGFFGEARPYFEWHPEIVELSADGELGLSRGPWTIRVKRPDGTEVEQSGIFNSVWRRQSDGSWRIVFDAGCNPCPRCGG